MFADAVMNGAIHVLFQSKEKADGRSGSLLADADRQRQQAA
jgi:hypothetical protein